MVSRNMSTGVSDVLTSSVLPAPHGWSGDPRGIVLLYTFRLHVWIRVTGLTAERSNIV